MTEIAIFGTGNLAATLGTAWTRAGREVAIAGRSAAKAATVADAVGGHVVEIVDLASAEVIVLAISPKGVEDALRLAEAPAGAWVNRVVIDATNPVDFATGRLLYQDGSMAERVAGWAPGAHVVKALHLFAGQMWLDSTTDERVVAMCGDDLAALALVGGLIADLGGTATTVGDLTASRQLEEVAGFVMRLAGAGHNPRSAIPNLG